MHIFYLPVFTIAVLLLAEFALCLPAVPDAAAADQPAPPAKVQDAQEPPKNVEAVEKKEVDSAVDAPVPHPDAQPKDFPPPVGAGLPEKGALVNAQVDQPELHKDQQPAEQPAPNVADAKEGGEGMKVRFEDADREQHHDGDKEMIANGRPVVGDQKQQNLVDQEEVELPEKSMQDAWKKQDQLAHDDSIKAVDIDLADAMHANDQLLVQNWQKPELPGNNPIADTRTRNLSSWSMEYVIMALCLMIIAVLLAWRHFWYTVCTSCGSKTYASSGTTEHYKVAYKPL
ncbi:unnamed protein product [Dicrocoelium dendriticum]|nr:unnamed protein product [Dicrocoelium dendriticum]